MTKTALTNFHPLIQKWFSEQVGKPTDVQEQSWEHIKKDKHLLITAPTGSGKTLAAFLWAINQLVTGEWPGGTVRVLYISPMKALNNDVEKNLNKPLAEIRQYFEDAGEDFPAISVQTRSGDTPGSQRQRMYRRPPEIFITTPESLNIMLTSKSGRGMFSGVTAVILDEIHAVLSEKRGTHLITGIERLTGLSGEFQRIALSATVKPLEKVAAFVGGYVHLGGGSYRQRDVLIVRSAIEKKLKVSVTFPPDAQNDLVDETWWPALVKDFKHIIGTNKSTLFFANSRRLTEKVTRFINEEEKEELAYSHHGSLSKEIRLAVEQKLKEGELRAIVATNSLELGIDIGNLDRVVMIQSPQSVSSAIQRIGRSGHSVNETSEGLVYPLHGKDFMTAAVIARSVMDKDIEEIHPVECPLDVLAQIILSMGVPGKQDIDELYDKIRTSYPFHTLSRAHYNLVVSMLAGRYTDSRIRELRSRVRLDKLENTIETADGVAFLLYTGGGTIPDRGSYILRHQENKAKIGELDEEFVWERRLGETFTLGTQVWRIQKITHNDVEVIPVSKAHNIIPFWKGDEVNRNFHLSEKIGLFLEEFNETVEDEGFYTVLMESYFMDPAAARYLQSYLQLQKEITGKDLPHRHHILIEHYDDPLNTSDSKQVILHTFWGGKVNHPFSLALSAAWQEKHNYPLQVFADNDCIVLMLPHEFSVDHILSMVNSDNLESLLRKRLEESGYFGARFRENAGRALLLPRPNIKKRMPLWVTRLRSKKLLEAVMDYEDFPVLLETWRECLQDDFDLVHLKLILDELESGTIAVSQTITKSASPFASGVIWKQTNKYMYEDDTPDRRSGSSLSDQLIKDLVFTSHLRPHIDKNLISLLESKLHRTHEGYAPTHPDDLVQFIKDRLLIPSGEWEKLLDASVRDSGLTREEICLEAAGKVVFFLLPGSAERFLCSIEKLPYITGIFRIPADEAVLEYLPGVNKSTAVKSVKKAYKIFAREQQLAGENEADPGSFLAAWLSYYGPFEIESLLFLFGNHTGQVELALHELEESKQAVIDRFSQESKKPEICDTNNLEILLRMVRRSRQPAFEPLEAASLPLFVADFQGVTRKGNSIEEMQHILDTLFGFPAAAGAWEEYIFPSRLEPYYKSWLDSLLQSSDLTWFGCSEKKTSFAFKDDLELFGCPGQEKGKGKNKEYEKLKTLFPEERGKYTFFDIKNFSHMDSAALSTLLWKLVWKGYISNDSYEVLRKGWLNGFKPFTIEGAQGSRLRRGGVNRWESSRPISGAFYILDNPGNDGEDRIYNQEIIKDRIRVLFMRWGILFRELTLKELPFLQWKNIFKTLYLMELSGEILSGYFFKGIPGPQFISFEALRHLQKGLPEESIFWLNACDPASFCGLRLEEIKFELPQRIGSNAVIYHGAKPVVIVKRNGKELIFNVNPDCSFINDYLDCFKDFLTREFNPLNKISVETINEKEARKSPYLAVLKAYGFRASHKGVELWKRF